MTSGANTLQVLRRIVMALVAPALINGWLWVASHSMRELTFPLLLVSANNVVIGTLLWEYWAQGQVSETAALAVVLVLALVLLVMPVRLWYTTGEAGRV